jgi:peptidoglycan/xylan/chitin deacetylase (PgdA/CDA1 family)
MAGARYAAIRMVLRALAATRLDRALAPLTRGAGAILTFHRVTQDALPLLPENAGLNITPEFLDVVLHTVKAAGYDIIALDELPARLAAHGKTRYTPKPFVVLTFDDGYRDLRDAALPVLKAHDAPFAAFICTGFAGRTAPLWWLDLEAVATRAPKFEFHLPTGVFAAPAGTPDEKRAALRALYWRLRDLDETPLRAAIAMLCAEFGVDPRANVTSLCMDWDEVAAFAKEPLVTIGAHSLSHPRLGFLPEETAEHEMRESRALIEMRLGTAPRHFCYPVGDARSAGAREAVLAAKIGYQSALTTRPGVLKAGADMLLLPRISVNGLFQSADEFRTLLSGVPFIGR